MKIRNANFERIPFYDIDCGEVFSYPADRECKLYMKMYAIEDSDYKVWNAVCLSNGSVEDFQEDSEVIPVSGEYVRD